jgi:hypothetical protein
MCAAERSGSLINDENCKSVAERAGADHFLNATIVRAHQHAAGARKGKGADVQSMGDLAAA